MGNVFLRTGTHERTHFRARQAASPTLYPQLLRIPASTTLDQVQNVLLHKRSFDLMTSPLMARQKDRSGARLGETLS